MRLIGRGSFGAVYEIEREVFGHKEKAALKVISIPQNDGDIEELYDSGYDEASVKTTFHTHLQSIVSEYSLMREMNGAANVVNCDDFRIVAHDDNIGRVIMEMTDREHGTQKGYSDGEMTGMRTFIRTYDGDKLVKQQNYESDGTLIDEQTFVRDEFCNCLQFQSKSADGRVTTYEYEYERVG